MSPASVLGVKLISSFRIRRKFFCRAYRKGVVVRGFSLLVMLLRIFMAFEVSEVIAMTSDALLLYSSDVLQPFVSPYMMRHSHSAPVWYMKN